PSRIMRRKRVDHDLRNRARASFMFWSRMSVTETTRRRKHHAPGLGHRSHNALLASIAVSSLLLVGGCITDPAEYYARTPAEYTLDRQGYSVSFVEFDDQGWLHTREQLQNIIDRLIKFDTQDHDVVVVVFVHGWKHNAHPD